MILLSRRCPDCSLICIHLYCYTTSPCLDSVHNDEMKLFIRSLVVVALSYNSYISLSSQWSEGKPELSYFLHFFLMLEWIYG